MGRHPCREDGSVNFLHVMEPDSSLLRSRGPPPVPILSPMNPVNNFPPNSSKIHFNIILQIYAKVFHVVSSLQVFQPKFCMLSHLSHVCPMPCLSHPP